jgi:hypothetical protein
LIAGHSAPVDFLFSILIYEIGRMNISVASARFEMGGISAGGRGKLKQTFCEKEDISMTGKKMDHPNAGIKCSVNTCHYYMNGDFCCADKIHVEPRNATSSDQTDCATFQKK